MGVVQTPGSPIRIETTPSDRLHALDLLRALAMLLGVVLHAAAAYMYKPMPGLLWPVVEPGTRRIVDGVFWFIHGFRVPLFMLMSGFFAAMLVRSRGPKAFLGHRLRRIGAPFVVSTIILCPLSYGIWGWGLVADGRATFRQVRRLSFGSPIQDEIRGLAHLWFLEYLLIYCLIYWLWVAWRGPRPAHPLWEKLSGSPARVVMLAVPSALIFWIQPVVFDGFRNAFHPHMADMAYYGWFFLVGACLFHADARLEQFGRGAVAHLAGAAVLFALLMTSMLNHDVLRAIGWALFCWCFLAGAVGAAQHLVRGASPTWRYLADSAYWVYLIHLPVVALVQMGLRSMRWSAEVKLVVVSALTAGICLLTYHWFVRSTFIGRFLSGSPPAKVDDDDEPTGDADVVACPESASG